MQEWFNLLIDGGTSVFILAYFCYMNYKYNQTILESLTVIKTMLSDLTKKEKDENE